MRYIMMLIIALVIWLPAPVAAECLPIEEPEVIVVEDEELILEKTIDETITDLIDETNGQITLLSDTLRIPLLPTVPALPSVPLPVLPMPAEPIVEQPAPPVVADTPSEPQNAPSEPLAAPSGPRVPTVPAKPVETLSAPPVVTSPQGDGESEPEPGTPSDTPIDISGEEAVPFWVTVIFAVVAVGAMIYGASERRFRKRLDKRLRKGLD